MPPIGPGELVPPINFGATNRWTSSIWPISKKEPSNAPPPSNNRLVARRRPSWSSRFSSLSCESFPSQTTISGTRLCKTIEMGRICFGANSDDQWAFVGRFNKLAFRRKLGVGSQQPVGPAFGQQRHLALSKVDRPSPPFGDRCRSGRLYSGADGPVCARRPSLSSDSNRFGVAIRPQGGHCPFGNNPRTTSLQKFQIGAIETAGFEFQ